MSEFISSRRPIDEYQVDTDSLRPGQRVIFNELEGVAHVGADIYLAQKYLLRPYRGKFTELVKDDPLADHRSTLPESDGRFVYYWEHSEIRPLLQDAQARILSASSLARSVGEAGLEDYLYVVGNELTTGNKQAVWEKYLAPLPSRINFHILFEETEKGKEMCQVYVGVVDAEETRKAKADIKMIREAGMRRNRGVWFTPSSEISVDNEGVVAGFLSSEASRQRRREAGIEEGVATGASAENLPNDREVAEKYGTRLIFYQHQFKEVVQFDILSKCDLFLASGLMPKPQGVLRFVELHEFQHDERYANYLGELHTALRESYANQGGLDLGAEVWDSDMSGTKLLSVVSGALGYAIRDCYEVLSGKENTTDLGRLMEVSNYIPGNLAWINLAIQEGAFVVRGGLITHISIPKTIDLSRRLAAEERKLLRNGTIQDVRNYFEGNLPKTALPLGKLGRPVNKEAGQVA